MSALSEEGEFPRVFQTTCRREFLVPLAGGSPATYSLSDCTTSRVRRSDFTARNCPRAIASMMNRLLRPMMAVPASMLQFDGCDVGLLDHLHAFFLLFASDSTLLIPVAGTGPGREQ